MTVSFIFVYSTTLEFGPKFVPESPRYTAFPLADLATHRHTGNMDGDAGLPQMKLLSPATSSSSFPSGIFSFCISTRSCSSSTSIYHFDQVRPRRRTHVKDLTLGRFGPLARFVGYLECRGKTLGFGHGGSDGSDRRRGTIGTCALCSLSLQAADQLVSIDCDSAPFNRGRCHPHDLLG
jgi:hypothetical protein